MIYTLFALAIIAAYLLGSIPFGLLIAKAHGKDLRSIGSGNIGATNVSRALGRKWGYFCFLLDVLKGLLPTLATMSLTRPLSTQSYAETIILLWLWLAVGSAAILGHIFPIYLKFKGGKGVATSFGVALGLWPYYTIAAAIAFAIWLVVVLATRYVSLASIAASLAFPIVLILAILLSPTWNLANLWPLLTAATAIPIMVILRHRENIKRLLAGTESKVLDKKSHSQPTQP
ncbi:MAG: glycerol-3-phosphate 1-O-acyltransferase PlsY [Planctomycetota bacterium]|jgi:glycerol-3-phosphate acyltransferase PlsY